MASEHLSRLITRNGLVLGSVLVDGYVQGTWKISQKSIKATLAIDLFTPVPRHSRTALVDEGGRLLEFATSREDLDVRFI